MNPWDREVYARTIWCEARSLTVPGMRAVGHAIWNRYVSGKWFATFNGKTTIALVCMKDQQFSCWNAAKDDTNREQQCVVDYDDPLLQRCRLMVDEIMSGRDVDNTDGATHYINPAAVAKLPSWVEGATPTVVVDAHSFFKGVL